MLDTPRSLLDRLAKDPAEADWRRLVGLYQPLISRWLGLARVPAGDAADLSQDVLTVLVKEIPAFRHSTNTGAFRKWLRMIVLNRVRGYWRDRLARPAPAEDSSLLDALEDPDSQLSRQWDRDHDAFVTKQLLDALEGEFSPTVWAAFRGQVVEGKKAAAVAAELHTTVNAALISKSRVLRRLRQEADGLLDPA